MLKFPGMNGTDSVTVTDTNTDAVFSNGFFTLALFIMRVMNKFKLMNLNYLKTFQKYFIFYFLSNGKNCGL